jgi:hypothetical protein
MYSDFVCSDISIPYYANLHTEALGLDSLEHCIDKNRFVNHAPIDYRFNSLGFRTHNVDQFHSNAILVLGDSFTLGLGNRAEERFTDILEKNLSHQVLNFSLNGASNDWICRKLGQLLTLFQPRAIVLHYTFSHRRERLRTDWHDDERTECDAHYSSHQNFQNWLTNYEKICQLAQGTKCVHSFITNWHDAPVDYHNFGSNVISPTTQLDFARDAFHYGPRTHQLLADKITSLLVL